MEIFIVIGNGMINYDHAKVRDWTLKKWRDNWELLGKVESEKKMESSFIHSFILLKT